MSPLLLLVFVGLTVGQPHGPGEESVTCYDCHGPQGFPECLNHVRDCHRDEVCQFNYGGHATEIRCHKRHDCEHQVDGAARQCSTGGARVHDSCQICCNDDQCITDSVAVVQSASAANINLQLHCPADCELDNLAACVSSGHVCNNHQYCKVSLDENNGHMHGRCEEAHDIHHCRDQVDDHECDPRHHNCIVDCCTDDHCIAGTFGANETSLNEFLKGDCKDQLLNNQCAQLDTSQHLCGDHLALRVCPETCGLCSVYSAFHCEDIVADNGCPDLVTSEDICNNPLALHLCPSTCNMCDALLNEAIKTALQNGTAPTGPPQVTCDSLVNQDCVVLNDVCPMVNCPAVCDKCSTGPAMTGMPSTIPPDVTVQGTDMTGDGLNAITCESLEGQGCGVLDAVCQLVNCPRVCDPCFTPIVTMPPADSTVVPGMGDTTVACEDTIQEMNCTDVTDVCSSPLLVNYCKKYCGLC